MSIRLLLVDDNILFRKGLAALLSLQPDLSVVVDAASGKDLLQLSATSDPHVLVMDIMLAGTTGLDTAVQIKRRLPLIKTILLTASRTENHLRAALRAGIDGYVLKDASLEELLIAIRSVAKGKKYLSPDVSGQLVDNFLHPGQAAASTSQFERLTSRERGVLQLIAEGRTNRSAAEFLSLSPKTVEKHRASLMQKLGLRNATEMMLAAMEMGLIERPPPFSRGIHDSDPDAALDTA